MTEKGNDNSWIEVEVMRVPANFFSFMNIPLEQGRAPKTEADIVADRTWQQRMKKDILGMPLYDSQRDYTVCGICAPFQTDTYSKSIGYVFLLYNPSDYIGHCYLKCHSGQVQEVKVRVEQLLREALPESVPVRVGTLLDDIHDRQPLEYTMKNIVLFFAVVSILITLPADRVRAAAMEADVHCVLRLRVLLLDRRLCSGGSYYGADGYLPHPAYGATESGGGDKERIINTE